ncbi:MAG: thioredoxin-dependent peroxiredoxin [Chloroflexota bacterium]|jgi:peroxiredoxin Q/BCP|nr:thioredoxin-dependent peroxiredoxin [Chloroflexota bacterium]
MMAELKVGDQAPEFAAKNDQGETVRLSDLKGKRVVLYFYPKDDTRGCTIQACGFRDQYPTITEKNAIVLGVSADDESSHQAFKSKFDLPFPLLVDADHQVSEAYGTWRERERDGVKSMGMARSHFVIDEQGKLADVQYNVAPEDSSVKALEILG